MNLTQWDYLHTDSYVYYRTVKAAVDGRTT
jgi:hypothetical protein